MFSFFRHKCIISPQITRLLCLLTAVCSSLIPPAHGSGIYFTNGNASGLPPIIGFHEPSSGFFAEVLPRNWSLMPYDIVYTYPPNLDYDPLSDRLFFNAGNKGGLYSSK